jgi:hypothetical protein
MTYCSIKHKENIFYHYEMILIYATKRNAIKRPHKMYKQLGGGGGGDGP